MAYVKSQVTAARILDVAALGLFRTEGFDQTTMRDIAAAAGMATGPAYYPLSPFSAHTRGIRATDVDWFRRILEDVPAPRDLAPHLPDVLWLFQMGIIYFRITDTSASQTRTTRLLAVSVRVVMRLLRLANLPFTRPLRKPLLELIKIMKGQA